MDATMKEISHYLISLQIDLMRKEYNLLEVATAFSTTECGNFLK
jgi:hypothetical protein